LQIGGRKQKKTKTKVCKRAAQKATRSAGEAGAADASSGV